MKFIEQVTNDLIAQGWDSLKDYTVVFPMHRAGLFMKDQLKAEMKRQRLERPVIAPGFITLDELVDEFSAPYLQPDDEIHSVCQLYSIYKQVTSSQVPLDVFYGWGRQLLTDFSNTDKSEVDAAQLFANSAEARQLEEVILDEETRQRLLDLMGNERKDIADGSIRKTLQDLWAALPKIYAAFREQQLRQGIAYGGARLRYVVEHFDEAVAPRLGNRQFAFVGFNYLLAKERELMLRLQDRSRFYWDHDPHFSTNRDAYKYTAANIALFGQNLPSEEDEERTADKPKPVTVIATATASAQAQFVHEWLEERAGASGQIGVVIADEAMLEPVIYALPDRLSGRANITKGYPLRNTSVFAYIITYLSDNRNDRQAGETYADVLRRLTDNIAARIDSERNPENTSWQQALVQESYYQAQRVISRFSMLIEDGTLSEVEQLSTLRNLLRRHLETVLLPFHGDPITPVQVIGVLETRLLDFDHLLVLNVEEGVVPNTLADNSFIPFYLRKYYHMPTGTESAEVYAYNFFRLLRRSQDTTLLFCNATEGNNKKSMSRFLMQMLTSPTEFEVKKGQLVESSQIQTSDLQLIDSALLPLYAHRESLRLSPSSLGTYLECPMRFYLEKVLRLNANEPVGLVMKPNEIGTLVHGTLEAVYRRIGGYPEGEVKAPFRVTPEAIDTYLNDPKQLDEMLGKGFEGLKPYRREEHRAETLVAKTHVRRVLETDRALAGQPGGLTIVGLEQPWQLTLPVETGSGYVNVQISGVIDRLDIVNGRLRVIDYKSGSYKPAYFHIASPEELTADDKHKYMLQTFIYGLACLNERTARTLNPHQLPLAPGLLFPGKKDCDPTLKINNQPVLNFADYKEEVQALLTAKVREIITATDFPKQEAECKPYCPFLLLCARKAKKFN